jgi:hypothetical protein
MPPDIISYNEWFHLSPVLLLQKIKNESALGAEIEEMSNRFLLQVPLEMAKLNVRYREAHTVPEFREKLLNEMMIFTHHYRKVQQLIDVTNQDAVQNNYLFACCTYILESFETLFEKISFIYHRHLPPNTPTGGHDMIIFFSAHPDGPYQQYNVTNEPQLVKEERANYERPYYGLEWNDEANSASLTNRLFDHLKIRYITAEDINCLFREVSGTITPDDKIRWIMKQNGMQFNYKTLFYLIRALCDPRNNLCKNKTIEEQNNIISTTFLKARGESFIQNKIKGPKINEDIITYTEYLPFSGKDEIDAIIRDLQN